MFSLEYRSSLNTLPFFSPQLQGSDTGNALYDKMATSKITAILSVWFTNLVSHFQNS